MKYRERLCIILMRDNGPRRSFRVRRGFFFAAATFFACLPLAVAILGWQYIELFNENTSLRANMLRFETQCREAQATAERLEHFEELLNESGMQGREMLVRRLAGAQNAAAAADSAAESEAARANANASAGASSATTTESAGAGASSGGAGPGEGPGHEEFPVVDTGYIKVGNVQARSLRGGKLRIALDLHNADTRRLASGTVNVILLTANGVRHVLKFEPEDVGDFRINRFKRTVMAGREPANVSLVNARVILEVRNGDNEIVYSNIYAVER